MDLEEFIMNLDFTSMFWQVSGTLLFMLSDIISGFISAVINHNVDSQKMREGIMRKGQLLLVIALAFIFQYMFFNMEIISKFVCLYIVFMEVVSILENLSKSGIDLGKIVNILNIKGDK